MKGLRVSRVARDLLFVTAAVSSISISTVMAQESLPEDNGLASYHTAPRYRESESHPLRIVAYALHPVGWLAREVIFRPFSYFASSTETTRSVLGFREPFDYRAPECFSADDSTPDCRSISPFNYAGPSGSNNTAALHGGENQEQLGADGERQVYFPDVNFDFNSHKLSDLGRGRAHQIARLLNNSPGLKVVLQGHTDFKGSAEFNERLGMERAESLRQELVSLGVSAERLSTVTFGKSQPLLAEQEDWARAVNRRVQIQAGSKVPADESRAAAGESNGADSSWQVAE